AGGPSGDRARRLRGTPALGAARQQLGVAPIQTRDGIVEPIGGEDLDDDTRLDDDVLLSLVVGDVEAATGGPTRRDVASKQSQRVAERRERLVSNDRVL